MKNIILLLSLLCFSFIPTKAMNEGVLLAYGTAATFGTPYIIDYTTTMSTPETGYVFMFYSLLSVWFGFFGLSYNYYEARYKNAVLDNDLSLFVRACRKKRWFEVSKFFDQNSKNDELDHVLSRAPINKYVNCVLENKDLCTKIIACCDNSTRRSLYKMSHYFHTLCAEKNVDIYMHNPLVLENIQFPAIYALYNHKNNIYRSIKMHASIADGDVDYEKIVKQTPQYILRIYCNDVDGLKKSIKRKQYKSDYIAQDTGNNVFHIAATRGNNAVLQLLLKHASRNHQLYRLDHHNKQGFTPISLAAHKGYMSTTELLLPWYQKICPEKNISFSYKTLGSLLYLK